MGLLDYKGKKIEEKKPTSTPTKSTEGKTTVTPTVTPTGMPTGGTTKAKSAKVPEISQDAIVKNTLQKMYNISSSLAPSGKLTNELKRLLRIPNLTEIPISTLVQTSVYSGEAANPATVLGTLYNTLVNILNAAKQGALMETALVAKSEGTQNTEKALLEYKKQKVAAIDKDLSTLKNFITSATIEKVQSIIGMSTEELLNKSQLKRYPGLYNEKRKEIYGTLLNLANKTKRAINEATTKEQVDTYYASWLDATKDIYAKLETQ